MSPAYVLSSGVLLPAAEALTAVAAELEGVADEVEGVGRTALVGAGQFADELSEGACVLSLSWSAATGHAGLSATTIASVATQAVTSFAALDTQAAGALAAGRP